MPEPSPLLPFQNQDSTPFNPAELLTPAMPYEQMTHTHIMQLESRPDVIVRVGAWGEAWKGDRTAERLRLTELLITELTEKYAVPVVPIIM